MNRERLSQRQSRELLEEAHAFRYQGRLDQARQILERVVAADPMSFPAHFYHGVILCQLGRYGDSLPDFRAALKLAPQSPEASCALGHALQSIGRHEESLVHFDSASRFNPAYSHAHYNKGVALRALKRNEEAISSFDAALRINPKDAEAWNNRGCALYDLRRYEDSLICYDRALEIEPRFSQGLRNRAAALEALNRYREALVCYDKVLATQPEDVDMLYARAHALLLLKQFEQAANGFQKLLAVDPAYPYALGRHFFALAQCCDWSKYSVLSTAVTEGVDRRNRSSTPFAFLSVSDSPTAQKTCAETFAAAEYPPQSPALWTGERHDHRRIRLAYLSADYYEHATSFLVAGLIEHHDRSRFETMAVSLGPARPDSSMRQRLQSAFERFVDASRLSDIDVARLLRELEVDILVDLGGFTQDSGTGVLACRPAPVQVNYLGYPGTMGAGYVDYIVADRFVIPEEKAAYYSEKVVRLPHCFQANDSARKIADVTPSRAEMGLPDEGIVFCCFNNTYKITPRVFDSWMGILRNVVDSVLCLTGEQPCVIANLRKEATLRSVDPRRLAFVQRVPYEQYLARYRVADLFLDTLPFNGGATASDALWAGLPVLTCAGQAFSARMAGSVLNAVGLPELITDSLQEYEALAVQLARSPDRIARLKQMLVSNRNSHALFDTDRFRKDIEKAYIAMWERSQNGRPPASFDVEPSENGLT